MLYPTTFLISHLCFITNFHTHKNLPFFMTSTLQSSSPSSLISLLYGTNPLDQEDSECVYDSCSDWDSDDSCIFMSDISSENTPKKKENPKKRVRFSSDTKTHCGLKPESLLIDKLFRLLYSTLPSPKNNFKPKIVTLKYIDEVFGENNPFRQQTLQTFDNMVNTYVAAVKNGVKGTFCVLPGGGGSNFKFKYSNAFVPGLLWIQQQYIKPSL